MQNQFTNRWGRFGGKRFLHRSSVTLCAAAIIFNAAATNHILRQDEIMVGLNGDPAIQFIKITVSDGTQKAWGPGPGESTSRAMLVFFNSAGIETGRFLFPANAPIGANTVLVATAAFAAVPGAPVPDFIIPPLLSPGGGKVCFRGNPANRAAFGVNLCLSYGSIAPELTEGGGPPAPLPPIGGEPTSLARFRNFGFGGVNQNADFTLASPNPANTRGQTVIFSIPGPEIDFVPTNVNFAPRDMTLGASAPLSVVITNRGFANSLNISNVTLVATNPALFAIVNDSGQTVLPPGGTRTINVTFDPDTPGLKAAALRVVSNDENENISLVQLRGLGVDPNAPEIDAQPVTVTFGNLDVAAGPSPPVQVTVRNLGNVGTLFITNIHLTGLHADQFRLEGPTTARNLPPGGSSSVIVTFDPDQAGPKAAALRFISSDTDEGALDVPLSGRAFDLNPCTAPNPTNSVAQDIAANAQVIGPGLIFTGTTFGATPNGASSCGPQQTPDVWFRYVPGDNGIATVSVDGSTFVPTLSAHSAAPGSAINQLACDSATARPTPDAQVAVSVTNGAPVFFRVAGVSANSGSFQLTLTGPPAFNFDRNENGVTDSCEFDFGDAPAPYPTTLAANGARHRSVGVFSFGHLVDSDDDGQPSPSAAGDNEDGPPNDEDGITFAIPMVAGQTASVFVTGTTANAHLNAWIDFNADGDWADPGEQIFTNVLDVAGTIFSNPQVFSVPATATITNRTFARFRLSSAAGLSPTGEAPDGEVEDHLVEILPSTQTPGQLGVRINEVMAGLNGDSSAQFVELEVNGEAGKAWGPQGSESAGRAMLLFYDQAGRQTGRFVFPSNAPPGANTVLVATRAFAEQSGLTPDFIMPPEVIAIAGKVAFASNPDNRHFDIHVALAYGQGYFGPTDGAGPANPRDLAILHIASLQRVREVPFGLNHNSAFEMPSVATPRNTAGSTVALQAKPLSEQGRTLFTRETFRGNGRTCATCHVAGRDQFGLTPLTIASLPEEDPLFVFEHNVNLLKLSARSQPSDLRGEITGAAGTGTILSGSGDTYLVVGGQNLSGSITDATGNTGSFQSVAEGDLDGPTASNGSDRGLEAHNFLEHGRGLILENIDNFKHKEVFRASPHLLNLNLTAPFGLSGEFDSLDVFSDGAVVQHFPKSLARISGIDFRHPTLEELSVMSTFMFGLTPAETNAFNLDRFATTEAQKRGRALFFGDQGRCSKCHSGPVLAVSDGSLSGSVAGVNENFNTGVANLLRNILDDMPTEPAGLTPGESTREFNTPPLFNIRLTAPFFHDGSAETLKEAVEFYDKEEFHNSPAGSQVGSILAANKPELVADVVAFLESLVDLPVDFTRTLDFGVHCPGSPMPGPLTVIITNHSAHAISLTNVVINGTNAAAFAITSDTGQTILPPGATRSIQVTFAPTNFGFKQATLELTGMDTNLLGVFSFGVALKGADIDTFLQAGPAALDFGTRDIQAPPSPERSIVIVNDGSIPLDMGGFALIGPNTNDFVITTELDPIPPHESRVIEVSFAPETAGSKSATLHLPVLGCNTDLIEIPLTGVASSTIATFAWEPFAGTQYMGRPFPVRITARDQNDDTVEDFTGRVDLSAFVPSVPGTVTVPITPLKSGPFTSGVWTGSVTVLQPAPRLQLDAVNAQGHQGTTEEFVVLLPDDLSLTLSNSPNPNPSGQVITYEVAVRNSGPNGSTGVVITNQLSPNVTFVSAVASQGTIGHSGGIVVATLGSLASGAAATVTIRAEPNVGSTNVVNIATVTRIEPELILTNNIATNTTAVGAFGLLVVRPATNFMSSGFSGGPFTPTNQIYSLSNAGTAPLSWQVRASGCVLPDGIVGWWPLDGNAADQVGTNVGIISGNPIFTNGLVGQALVFDGIDDAVHIAASPALNVGSGDGFTLEAWIQVPNLTRRGPVFEWDDGTVNVGPHLWVSVTTPGSLFANIVDTGNNSHQIISPENLLQPNVWQHIAVTYNKTTGLANLYLNGTNVIQQNLGIFTPRTGINLLLGRRGNVESFMGLIDEPSVFGRELSAEEIQTIFAADNGKCASQGGNCNLPDNLTGWWPLDGNVSDRIGTNDAQLLGGPAFRSGIVGQALSFDGIDDQVEVRASPALNIGIGTGFTLELWINPSNLQAQQPLLEWVNQQGGLGVHFWLSQAAPAGRGPGCLFANLIDTGNISHHITTPGGLITTGVWQHVALTYERASGQGTIYLNGQVIGSQQMGSFTPQTAAPLNLSFGRRTGSSFLYSGAMDEVSIYDRALSGAEIAAITSAGSSGKCPGQSWYISTPFAGALLPGASTNLAVALNTNANQLAVGRYSDVLIVNNASNGRGSTERTVSLAVLNRRPTLGPLPAIQMAEDSGPRTVNLAGIRAGGSEQQNLTVAAFSSNTDLIANPMPVNYTNPGTNGTLVFTPLTNAHGTTTVSVVVRDDAGTANGGFDAVTNTFLVTVTPVNDAPAFVLTPDQTVNEGDALMLTSVVIDPDLPNDQLTFNLLAGPSGMTLNPATGVLSWTPTETQGPSTNSIFFTVSDSGTPSLHATNRFVIIVAEVNSAPTLAAVADQIVHEGMLVTWIAPASDSDLPGNRLTYSLAAGAPVGASVNPLNGSFNWIAQGVPVPGTNAIVYTVSDDGTPALGDSRSCRVIVVGPPRITEIRRAGTSVALTWTAIPGLRYRVQFKDNLSQPDWTNLPGEVLATGQTASKVDTLGPQQRFYRIRVGNE